MGYVRLRFMTPCPHCGCTAYYGSGDLATCANPACARWLADDEPATNAEGDALNAEAGAAEGTWRAPRQLTMLAEQEAT